MGIAIKALETLRGAAGFALRWPKDALIVALITLLAITGWRLNRERGRSRELAAKTEGLPADTKQVVTIYRDRVVTKWRDGATRIEYRDRYLPSEGHVEIVTKENQPEKPAEVVIKDWGLTERLGGGIVYSRSLLPLVDLKWAYWQRYSLSIGFTPRFGGVGISRHIDDFTPFHNIEIVGLAGLDWSGDRRLALGLRTNF